MLKTFYHDLIHVDNSVLSNSFVYLTSPFTQFSNFRLHRSTDKGIKSAPTLQRDGSAVKGSAHNQMPKVPWTYCRKAHVDCSCLWFGIFLPTVTVGCRGCKGCFWSNPSIQDPSTYNHFQLTPQGRMAIRMTKTQSWSITYIEKHTDYCWFYWISEDPPIK